MTNYDSGKNIRSGQHNYYVIVMLQNTLNKVQF